jgi:hypothetical protein
VGTGPLKEKPGVDRLAVGDGVEVCCERCSSTGVVPRGGPLSPVLFPALVCLVSVEGCALRCCKGLIGNEDLVDPPPSGAPRIRRPHGPLGTFDGPQHALSALPEN